MTQSTKKGAARRIASLFRFRLWMILLLFVPTAYFANRYGSDARILYFEKEAQLWTDGMTKLDFSSLPDGTLATTGLNIDTAYENIGVTFSFGTPLREPGYHLETSATTAQFVNADGGVESNADSASSNPEAEPGKQEANPAPNTALGNQSSASVPNTSTTKSGFIGVSGYSMTFPNFKCSNTIAPVETTARYKKRFVGNMTIRFHEPREPEIIGGVYKVGFYAARLEHAEALQVSLNGLNGKLLCKQANISKDCVFMGFGSNKRVSRIEIETIGTDESYAIGGLIFDNGTMDAIERYILESEQN